jgi:hypothetical protein
MNKATILLCKLFGVKSLIGENYYNSYKSIIMNDREG